MAIINNFPSGIIIPYENAIATYKDYNNKYQCPVVEGGSTGLFYLANGRNYSFALLKPLKISYRMYPDTRNPTNFTTDEIILPKNNTGMYYSIHISSLTAFPSSTYYHNSGSTFYIRLYTSGQTGHETFFTSSSDLMGPDNTGAIYKLLDI